MALSCEGVSIALYFLLGGLPLILWQTVGSASFTEEEGGVEYLSKTGLFFDLWVKFLAMFCFYCFCMVLVGTHPSTENEERASSIAGNFTGLPAMYYYWTLPEKDVYFPVLADPQDVHPPAEDRQQPKPSSQSTIMQNRRRLGTRTISHRRFERLGVSFSLHVPRRTTCPELL